MKNKAKKKLSVWAWAFIALMLVFFVVGICTLGCFRSTGKSLTVTAEKTAYYDLKLKKDEKLDGVYVNVGAVYAPVGDCAEITVRYSTSASSTTNWSTFGASVKVANITSGEGRSGANYNWIKIADGQAKKNVQRVSFTTDVNLDLCEIVCVNAEGERIDISVNAGNTDFKMAAVEATVDAQKSFVFDNDAYYNFTQEEGYLLTSMDTILGGKAIYEDSVYTLTGNFNYLAVLLTMPLTLLFGGSVFALRITPFLATCAMIVFAYLLLRELLKEEKYAFVFSALIALGGMATTLGRLGTGYALVASAVVASAYFAYRFFAKGISAAHTVKDGMNVFASGAFSAVAMAMDSAAIFPVLGVLVLLGFGFHRQQLAKKVALEKAETEEKTKEIDMLYAYKNRVFFGFAMLSFVALTFILLLVSGVIAYSAALKTYGTETGFVSVLWQGIASSLKDGDLTSFTDGNKRNVFAWFIPFLSSAELYNGASVYGAGEFLTWKAMTTGALSAVCPLAFLGLTAKTVYDFVKKDKEKETLRVRRTYFVLLGGMIASLIAGAFSGGALSSLLFTVCYVGSIPALAAAFERKNGVWKWVANGCLIALGVATCVTFALSVPAMYGIVVSV